MRVREKDKGKQNERHVPASLLEVCDGLNPANLLRSEGEAVHQHTNIAQKSRGTTRIWNDLKVVDAILIN